LNDRRLSWALLDWARVSIRQTSSEIAVMAFHASVPGNRETGKPLSLEGFSFVNQSLVVQAWTHSTGPMAFRSKSWTLLGQKNNPSSTHARTVSFDRGISRRRPSVSCRGQNYAVASSYFPGRVVNRVSLVLKCLPDALNISYFPGLLLSVERNDAAL
jgi:hypothetical protein